MVTTLPDQIIPIESIVSSETGEKAPAPEASKLPVTQAVKEVKTPTPAPAPIPSDPYIVDMRSADDKTQVVAADAQKLTQAADKEEEEFIKDVEQIHSIQP